MERTKAILTALSARLSIPWRLIQLYSNPNDFILDPFNGSGQTTKVAHHLGRYYIGVDTEQTYVDLAKQRLDEPLHLSTILGRDWESIKFQPGALEKYR